MYLMAYLKTSLLESDVKSEQKFIDDIKARALDGAVGYSDMIWDYARRCRAVQGTKMTLNNTSIRKKKQYLAGMNTVSVGINMNLHLKEKEI